MHHLRPSIALFLLFFSLSACVTYQRYQLPTSRILKIDRPELTFYLVDAAHPLSRVWYMSECVLSERDVACYLTKMTEAEAAAVTHVTNRKDARWSKNDVLFYADPKFAASLQDTSSLTINLEKLEKIEVYELNHLRTFGLPLANFTGLLMLYQITY